MKIRNGFVSNSSSSSFLVFGGSGLFIIPHMPKNMIDRTTLVVPYIFGGEVEFGRQRENYSDFGSRLNFAYLQAKSVQVAHLNQMKSYNEDTRDKNTIFVEQHKNDVELLEEVLLDNIEGLKKIDWRISSFEERFASEKGYHDAEKDFKEGYIDHGSNWMEKREEYEKIFDDKESIFQWLFGEGNYIANRSDEYSDINELEVNHKADYEWEMDGLFYDPWRNPEMFDDNGEFKCQN